MHWHKQDGRLPDRAYEERGSLTITNVQYEDSGVYICQGQSGNEVVERHVTITVGSKLLVYEQILFVKYGGWYDLRINLIRKYLIQILKL